MVARSVPKTRALTLEVGFGVSHLIRRTFPRSSAGISQDRDVAWSSKSLSSADARGHRDHLKGEVFIHGLPQGQTSQAKGMHTMPP